MNLVEAKTFEEKLKNDSQLNTYFEEFKTMSLIIEEETLRNKLDDFHNAIPEKTLDKKSSFNFYRIAASVAILISLSVWFFNTSNTNQNLFKQHFSPDPGLPTVMGTNDNYDFYEAMVDYKRGSYKIAIEKWEKQLLKKPKNDTLNYFLGAAYLADGNTNKAITFLEKNTKNDNITEAKDALLISKHHKSKALLLKIN